MSSRRNAAAAIGGVRSVVRHKRTQATPTAGPTTIEPSRIAGGVAVAVDQTLTPKPDTVTPYAATRPVRMGDMDSYTRLRLDGVARYLQDIAWDQLQESKFAETDPVWSV